MVYELHPLAALFPVMSEDDFAELKEDIRANGLLEKIVLYEDKILDGRHRYNACNILGIEPRFEQYSGDSPATFVFSKNIFRRHLTASQKAAIATEILPWYEKEAVHGGDRRSEDFQEGNISTMNGKARDRLGETMGVSGRYIQDAKKLKEEDPVKFEQVKSGELSLSEATKNVHVSNNSGENEWDTPPEYIEAAREVMGSIDCDPASSDKANEIVKATVYYTKETNGLDKEWKGNVWMNPPYSQPLIDDFSQALVRKFEEGEIADACVLINNATETEWLQRMIKHASYVCLVKKRIKFIDKDGNPSGAPLQGQVILYFGSNGNKFIYTFKQFGIILCPIIEE